MYQLKMLLLSTMIVYLTACGGGGSSTNDGVTPQPFTVTFEDLNNTDLSNAPGMGYEIKGTYIDRVDDDDINITYNVCTDIDESYDILYVTGGSWDGSATFDYDSDQNHTIQVSNWGDTYKVFSSTQTLIEGNTYDTERTSIYNPGVIATGKFVIESIRDDLNCSEMLIEVDPGL